MSRRRPLRYRARIHAVRVVCTGSRHDPHRVRLVTTLRVNLDRPEPAYDSRTRDGRTDEIRQPRDQWTDMIDDPQPHYRWGSYDPADVGGSWSKVHLRCPVPACRPVLEAGPELADRLADELVGAGVRRVGLRDLVSLAARLSTSSRSVTGDAAHPPG